MLQQLLSATGLHADSQTTANLVAKLSGFMAAVGGGAVDVQLAARNCCGIALSDAAAGRIRWWAVAYGFVVVGWTSLNTDRPAGRPAQDKKP